MNSSHQQLKLSERKATNSKKFLNATATLWFMVAVLGQWIFAAYVALFYGGAALEGDFMKWNRVLPHGYNPEEPMNNLAVATHLFFAVVMLIGGPLQFVPKLRSAFPIAHRWNGRLYLLTALLVSLSGLYMVLTKGTISGLVGDISVSINAVLIGGCAVFALRKALARNFKAHQHWVLRLFLVISGVWFFRIGLMLWLFIHGGPVGFDPDTFRGPFLTFLGFGQYLIPLIVFELYLWIHKGSNPNTKFTMALGLLGLTILTGMGIFAATAGLWLPRL